MSARPSWMPKAPRVFLLAIFPLTTFILYLILELGCINDTMSVVSPIIVRSNGTVPLGAQMRMARVDMRIGFWGICFGPTPFRCTSSLSIFQSKSPLDLARSFPASRGGGNAALARLALALQANFAVLSGVVLFILVVLDLIANMVQIYFNLREEWEFHIKAAVWARCLDWAAAAGAVAGFSSYRGLVGATPVLIRNVPGGMGGLVISSGTVASNLFAAIVGITVAGAVVNTFLTMGEVGSVVSLVGEGRRDRDRGNGLRPGTSKSVTPLVKADIGRPDYVPVYKRRPAYEVFP